MGFTDDELIELIPSLTRYAYSLGRDADDLVQNTLERALVKRHLYTPGTLQGWLFRIMRNIRLDEARQRRVCVELDRDMTDQSQQTEINAYIRDVEGAINQLPSGQRDVLNYITFHGGMKTENPYRHCATALGINIGTVRSRLNRARETLREQL